MAPGTIDPLKHITKGLNARRLKTITENKYLPREGRALRPATRLDFIHSGGFFLASTSFLKASIFLAMLGTWESKADTDQLVHVPETPLSYLQCECLVVRTNNGQLITAAIYARPDMNCLSEDGWSTFKPTQVCQVQKLTS